MKDSLSYSEAQKLAAKVRDYWWKRGYDVDVQAHNVTINGTPCWVVRSNLVNGAPRDKRHK